MTTVHLTNPDGITPAEARAAVDKIVGKTLVDVDVTIRVLATEVEIPADQGLDVTQAFARDFMARQASRSAASLGLPDATVAVTAVVREV